MIPVLISSVLTAFAFLPYNLGGLIFFSLIPFLSFLDQKKSQTVRVLLSFLWGLLVQGIALFWITDVTVEGWLALTFYHAIYVAVFGALWRRLGTDLLRVLLWTALEWVRQSLYCGSPWGHLAQGLAPWPLLIQLASLGGVLAVSFWVMGVNLFLWRVFKSRGRLLLARSGIAALLCVLVPLLFGFFRLSALCPIPAPVSGEPGGERGESVFRIAVVQPNILPDFKWSPESEEAQLEWMEGWSRRISRGSADLLVWPETALLDDPRLNPKAFTRFRKLCADLDCRLLIGAYDRLSLPGQIFNAVFLLDSGTSPLAVYHKINLVPFGEYIPFEKHFPALRHLTPIDQSFQRGDSLPLFSVGEKIKLAPLVCFEDALSSFVRRSVRNGAQLLITLTNDGWFRGRQGPLSHDFVARFRAVENGVPLIRCANTGVSSRVDSQGREVQVISERGRSVEVAGVMLCEVPMSGGWGTFFGRFGYAWIGALGIFCLWRRKRIGVD